MKTMPSKKIIIPKFTLSTNTAVLPAAVFVHHNTVPIVVGRVFTSREEAMAIQRELPNVIAAGASSLDGKYHLAIVLTEALDEAQQFKLSGIASRMLDWYIHNGINEK
jgi:hypothetical protein